MERGGEPRKCKPHENALYAEQNKTVQWHMHLPFKTTTDPAIVKSPAVMPKTVTQHWQTSQILVVNSVKLLLTLSGLLVKGCKVLLILVALRAFELRMTETVANGLHEVSIGDASEPERVALGGLKRQGKKGTVGTQRTGNATICKC